MYTSNLKNRPFFAPEECWENIVSPLSTEFLPKLLPDTELTSFYELVDGLLNKAARVYLNTPNYEEVTSAVWDAEDPTYFSADAGVETLLNAPEPNSLGDLPLDGQVYLSYYNSGIVKAFDAFKEGLRSVLYKSYDLRCAFYRLGLPDFWAEEVENLANRPKANDPNDIMPAAVRANFFHVEESGYKAQLKELRLWVAAVLRWNRP